LTVFLNLFANKAKPSVGSLPLMLNLLWADRHPMCHIKKMKKKNTDWLKSQTTLWLCVCMHMCTN
jgi:hypothetical protein